MKTTLSRTRMCVISRARYPQSELAKIVNVRGHWVFDEKQKLHGRSIYVMVNDNNMFKFEQQKKRFKMTEDEFTTILAQLKEILAKKNS